MFLSTNKGEIRNREKNRFRCCMVKSQSEMHKIPTKHLCLLVPTQNMQQSIKAPHLMPD